MDTKIIKTCLQNNGQKTILWSDDLIQKISKFNGYLNPNQVVATLKSGKIVHTSFSSYKLFND